MGKQALTAKQVQYLKPSATSRKEVPCGPPAGLYCVVHPSGRKTFALRYRWNRAPRKLTFRKPYPDLSLAAARAEAEAALELLRREIDPAGAKAEEEALAPNSFREVAAEWLQREVSETRTYREVSRIVYKEIAPAWKHRLITEVGRADVLRLLDAIVDRGAPVTANRTRSILLRLFGWGLSRGYIETSPITAIKPLVREKTRDRVLFDIELLEVWKAAGALGYPFGPFLHLLILTAQRRGEVAGMRWQDVDLKAALWTLPKEATKPGRVHDVPLSQPTLELLEKLPRFAGPFVFTTTSGEKAINGFSKTKVALDAKLSKKFADWTMHDLRRTAATHMARIGVAPHVLSAILNHAPGSTQGVTQIYNRFRYVEERREALRQWGEYVLSLAESKRKLVAS